MPFGANYGVVCGQFGVEDPRATHERVHEVAFSSSRKRMEVSQNLIELSI